MTASVFGETAIVWKKCKATRRGTFSSRSPCKNNTGFPAMARMPRAVSTPRASKRSPPRADPANATSPAGGVPAATKLAAAAHAAGAPKLYPTRMRGNDAPYLPQRYSAALTMSSAADVKLATCLSLDPGHRTPPLHGLHVRWSTTAAAEDSSAPSRAYIDPKAFCVLCSSSGRPRCARAMPGPQPPLLPGATSTSAAGTCVVGGS
mmetsp:Transcript_12510/g.41245  ORF Transcript_12510/g.41245 Transcript_12510/m.41245 type:complete len:206 (-) Transcript_12510:117-734(-)